MSLNGSETNLKCNQNLNVTKTEMLPKRKCHQSEISPKLKCHKTKIEKEKSQKIKYLQE